MVRKSAFSLRTFTLSSVTWYASVPVGWALILLAIYRVVARSATSSKAPRSS